MMECIRVENLRWMTRHDSREIHISERKFLLNWGYDSCHEIIRNQLRSGLEHADEHSIRLAAHSGLTLFNKRTSRTGLCASEPDAPSCRIASLRLRSRQASRRRLRHHLRLPSPVVWPRPRNRYTAQRSREIRRNPQPYPRQVELRRKPSLHYLQRANSSRPPLLLRHYHHTAGRRLAERQPNHCDGFSFAAKRLRWLHPHRSQCRQKARRQSNNCEQQCGSHERQRIQRLHPEEHARQHSRQPRRRTHACH